MRCFASHRFSFFVFCFFVLCSCSLFFVLCLSVLFHDCLCLCSSCFLSLCRLYSVVFVLSLLLSSFVFGPFVVLFTFCVFSYFDFFPRFLFLSCHDYFLLLFSFYFCLRLLLSCLVFSLLFVLLSACTCLTVSFLFFQFLMLSSRFGQ